MAYSPYKIVITFPIFLLLLVFLTTSSAQDLCPDYYSETCPGLSEIVKGVVEDAITNETRMGASLLRLHFHDCFVNGCDGSVLLDDTSLFKGEKTAPPNKNSLRGFEVVDRIKSAVEAICPGVVSCADILAIAARDSVQLLGGPYWDTLLGRNDSTTANFSAATDSIPPPNSSIDKLISMFNKNGLSIRDLTALSGAHTIGSGRCISARAHLYSDKDLNPMFANTSKSRCPQNAPAGDNNLLDLDSNSAGKFDNNYFKNVGQQSVALHSDQQLTHNKLTNSFVNRYINDPVAFNKDFVNAMIKMGNIKPGKGSGFEIRNDCRKANKKK